ncbi:PEP-CTERM sorting domain-containing protein [bacterium]|nr:PEP-CTERM sorting domain-containing protein [bacterium]
MKFRSLLAVLATVSCLSVANAAPLWHSIVLDSFDTTLGIALGPLSGTNTQSVLSGGQEVTSDSITGRRDLLMERSSGGTDVLSLSATPGGLTLSSSGTNVGNILMIQNDWGTTPNGANTFSSGNPQGSINSGGGISNGLDMAGSSIIAENGFSKFVLDIDATAGYVVEFSVLGADARNEISVLKGSYATAAKTTSGGAELLEFDLSDFDIKEGTFGTDILDGKVAFTWANVYGYAISVSGAGVTGASSFTISEVYATIPEPGSMLAMVGLFGGAGLFGFRRKRAAIRVSNS